MKQFYGLGVKGVSALHGGRHLRFTYEDQPPTYLPLAMCVEQPPRKIVEELSERGFFTLGKPAADRISINLSDVDHFAADNIIDRVGWVGPYFSFPSGRVCGAPDAAQMQTVCKPSLTLSRKRGSLKEWRRRVALPLTGQPLAILAAGLPLAAALARIVGLAEGFALEVIDPDGNGGAVLYTIAESVSGDVLAGPQSFGTARRDEAELRSLHADGLLMIQDPRADLAILSPARVRAEVLGLLRAGLGAPQGKAVQGPSSILIVGRESLVDLVGAGTPAANSVAEHLITLKLPDDQAFGVFERLPTGFSTSSAAIAAIKAGARSHHGAPLRRFISTCVKGLAQDPSAFRAEVGKSMALFLKYGNIDLNNPLEVAIANKFGLVYASLKLAREAEIVPSEWKLGAAVLACYSRYYVSHASIQPGAELIDDLAARPEVVVLKRKHHHSSETIRQTDIFIRRWAGKRVLMVRQEALPDLVPDEHRFLARSDVRARLIRDGEHLTNNRRLEPGMPQERLYCFVMPPTAKVE